MSYDYKCYVVLPHGAVCWLQLVIVDMSCINFRVLTKIKYLLVHNQICSFLSPVYPIHQFVF